MTSFPGTIFNADGKSLDPTLPDLLQEQIEGCPYRSMVTNRDLTPVVRVWLLANDATPDLIPPALMFEAVNLVLAGKGVLILAQRPEPEKHVRTGLLDALDLIDAPDDAAGHA